MATDARPLAVTDNEKDIAAGQYISPRASNLPTKITPPSETNQSSGSISILIPPPPLARSRYNRQLLVPTISLSGQTRLSHAKVLIVGLGGLGSPAALYLAGAGVQTLGLLDGDTVELTNLHRQIAHREDSVSQKMGKVQSAIRACRELNAEGRYVGHEMRLAAEDVLDVVSQYDVVLDCTDNPATRYLISDACVLLGKPLVSGAAQRLEGQLMVLNHPPGHATAASSMANDNVGKSGGSEQREKGPCYRCVFPRPPSPEMVRGCGEIGILGPVVGAIGVMMAGEAIRLIVQGEDRGVRKPSMLLYNAWSADPRGVFRVVGLRGRRKDCLACGDDDALRERGLERITTNGLKGGSMDYEGFCGVVEDVKVLGTENRIKAGEFLRKMGEERNVHPSSPASVVVDVREENEFELGTRVKGSLNIPISKILRNGTTAFEQLSGVLSSEEGSEGDPRPIIFVCQRGNDSQIAAQKLIEQSASPASSRHWIGDVQGGFFAMEKSQDELR